MKRAAAALLCLALAGCASPPPNGNPEPTYTVKDQPDGFVLTLAYQRYQFYPETAAVMAGCKSALLATAYEVAERKRRPIEQINEQRIRMTTDRNGMTGTTSCEASVPVTYRK